MLPQTHDGAPCAARVSCGYPNRHLLASSEFQWSAPTENQLSAVVRKAITSVRARLSPTLTDVGIPTGDRLRNALNGKAVARLKSSAGQIAETAGEVAKASATRAAKGLNKATDAIRKAGAASGHAMASAGRVVAHGVAHGAKAIGAFVSKGAAWIANRWSGLRGFERV